MNFWQSLGPLDLLLVAGLLLLARVLTTALPALRKLAIPPAIVAGVLGMVMGPGVLDVLAIQTGSLETVVYHCLALLYITMALQAAPRGKVRAGARSITFGVPFVIVAQGAIGLLFILGWSLVGAELHPGFGLMLALGFSQGPGQALALGASWEPSGFSHGGQAGLLMAALGFAVCSVVGVALFHIGRARGWHGHGGAGTSEDGDPGGAPPRAAIPGDLDALTAQIALVGAVYLVVWGLLTALTGQLGDEKLVARLWGFHFIFALGVALLVRKLLEATGLRDRVVDDQIQTRLSGLIIDAAAVCAIAALRVDLLADLIVPALALALVGGLLTTLFCVWIARRAFPDAPFAHLLLLFGCVTGTLPTGLVLLRMQDPELSSGAARNAIMGMPGAVLIAIPLLLFVIPMPITGWPDSYPSAVWTTAGLCAAYGLAILVGWRFLGPLRRVGGTAALWPGAAHPLESTAAPAEAAP